MIVIPRKIFQQPGQATHWHAVVFNRGLCFIKVRYIQFIDGTGDATGMDGMPWKIFSNKGTGHFVVVKERLYCVKVRYIQFTDRTRDGAGLDGMPWKIF